LASNATREVELALSVTTANADSILALRDDVAKLAKEGGSAAPEFNRLTTELDKLAAQASQLAELNKLSGDLARAAAAQDAAAVSAATLSTRYKELEAATAQASAVEITAKTALAGKKLELQAAGDAIKRLKVETDDTSKSNTTYTEGLRALTQQQLDLKAQVRDLTAAYTASKTATKDAATAQKDLSHEVSNAKAEAAATKREFDALNSTADKAKASLTAMGVSTDDLAVSQKGLVTALASTKTEIAASITVEQEAVKYVRFWEQALKDLDAQQAESAAAAKAAGDAIQNALGSVGVRSAQQIKDEITKVKSSLELLKSTGTLTGAEIANANRQAAARVKELELELRQVNSQLTLGDKAASLFSNSMGQITAGNLIADGIGYLVNKVKELGRAFLDAVVQGDTLKRGLSAIYKDAEITAAQIEFLRKTALDSGASLGELTKEFVRFSASMRSANIPLEQSNALFAAVTRAAVSLGLSAEATSGTLNALGQMASKGVVSMEELRQQLGDRLPGALGMAAKGLSITEAELVALVSSGNLAARDFFPALTKGLQDVAAETDGLLATWGRFTSTLTQTAQQAGDAGWTTLLSYALRALGGVVGSVALLLSGLSEGLFTVGNAAVALYARLRGDSGAWDFFISQSEKATGRLRSQAEALTGLLNPSLAATKAAEDQANAQLVVAANTDTARAAVASATATHVQSKAAIDLASNATLNAADSIVKYNVEAGKLLAQTNLQVDAAAKYLKAAKDEGEALVALAKVTGDTTKIREAEEQSVAKQRGAIEGKLAAQRAEIDLLVTQRQHVIDVANARGVTAEQIKGEIAAIDVKIAKAQPELEQTIKTAEALRAEALARKAATEAMADHAGQQDIYKAKIVQLQGELRSLAADESRGKNVKDALKATTEALAVATSNYRDALSDTVKQLDAQAIAQKASATASEIALNAQKSHYKAVEDSARAEGDYGKALEASIAQKKIDIKIIEAKVAAMKAEAEGSIAVAQAELAVLEASGKVDPVRRAQIQASIRLAEAKKLEAAAILEGADAVRREIDALRNGTAASAGYANSVRGTTNAIYEQNAALNANARALDAIRERTTASPVKSVLTKDDMHAVDNTGLYSLEQKLQNGSLGQGDLATAQGVFNASKANLDVYQKNANTFSLEGARSIFETYNKARSILEKVQGMGSAQGGAKNDTSYTVNLNVNGRNTPVKVASNSDAQALIRALQQAQTTAG